MKLQTFIDRPVLSSVISILIVLGGVIGLTSLPVEQYPDIAPPTVQVTTSYTGASAKTIQNAVIAPIEDAINGVEDMTYMTSTADNSGNVTITVYFKQGTDPDMATVNVQNRVSKVTALLPADVRSYGVTTEKRQNSILQIFAISSPTDEYDNDFLCNYMNINIKPKIMRIPGIGNFTTYGADYSMRIWLDPIKMQSYGLDPSDVTSAIAAQNIEAATGSFGEGSSEQLEYTMVYRGRLKSVQEFENVIIRVDEEGNVLHLRDVAKVELGALTYTYRSKVNGHPAALCMLFQSAGSNATQINESVAELLNSMKNELPSGTKIDVLYNTNDFLYASMHEVIKTLFEAIVLVVLIVLLFLHDFKSTLIPFVGIIVSLIGTFAFMMLVGFSLNLITLFALVLVIGTVVDDAIVVVEAVHEKLDAGYTSSRLATIDAMSEITTAVITSSLVFMAVFIPVSMMGGTSGVFFRQFGLTMAVAVGISAINALTLSPALCAMLLKPKNKDGEKVSTYEKYRSRFSKAFNAAFDKMALKYQGAIKPFINHPWWAFIIIIAFVALMAWSMSTTKSGFVPQEDTCQLMVDVLLPSGTSLEATSEYMASVRDDISAIADIDVVGQIEGYSFSGGNSSNGGSFILKLKPWEEREFMSVATVAQQIFEIGFKYPDATIIPFALPMIPGYGTNSNTEINLQDKLGGDINEFFAYAEDFIKAMNNIPEVQMAYTAFAVDNAQWLVDVDEARCQHYGLTASTVLNTLGNYFGGAYVNDINLYGKVYKVMVEAAPEYRTSPASLNNAFVKTASGEMAPLSGFVSVKKIYGASTLYRFNMLNSITITAAPSDGASSGDVIKAVEKAAKEALTRDYSYEFGGMAREESEGSSMAVIFGISALIIFLILAALYESYLLPFSILLTVPVSIAGAFIVTKFLGMDNNIYLQVGVVMLIGLISKTGILITEYALQVRKKGKSITEAALESARMRLRPILMTAGTMVIGLLPLLTSTGAGAMGNRSLGVGTVSGMLVGSIGLLVLVPALFVVFENLQEKIKPIKFEEDVK